MSAPFPRLMPTLRGDIQHYAADEHAPGDARRHVRTRLTQWGLSSIADDIEAATSELVTNASLHGGGGEVTLLLELARGCVLVRVRDGSPRPPVRCDPDPLLALENGRGLLIVEALSSRWGWYPDGAGKVVWAEWERGESANGFVRSGRAAS